ncbi:MAG: type 1 periplasmic-binding domain-containing protein, partial [Acidimicrobiales bacterium]
GSASDGVKGYPYQSDINTAQQQSTTTIAALKSSHVTTVVCFCDPIAPVFLSNTADQQNYHPEILLSGTGLLDYDKLARLYNPNVWKNAFGLSEIQTVLPFPEDDAARAWRDAGKSGLPDKTENLNVAYWILMGNAIQDAGPGLNPDTIRQGLFSAPARGGWKLTHGNPHYTLQQYRPPDDYTGVNDAREVWWCKSKVSDIDGEPGSYYAVDNGHRYDLGEWPGGDPQVFDHVCP